MWRKLWGAAYVHRSIDTCGHLLVDVAEAEMKHCARINTRRPFTTRGSRCQLFRLVHYHHRPHHHITACKTHHPCPPPPSFLFCSLSPLLPLPPGAVAASCPNGGRILEYLPPPVRQVQVPSWYRRHLALLVLLMNCKGQHCREAAVEPTEDVAAGCWRSGRDSRFW